MDEEFKIGTLVASKHKKEPVVGVVVSDVYPSAFNNLKSVQVYWFGEETFYVEPIIALKAVDK